MRRFHSAFFVAVVLLAPVSIATADDREVAAILSKAMKALGGEDKLSKIEAVTWKTTGWMNMLFQGPEHFKCTGELTIAGLDRSRSELIMLDSGGNKRQDQIRPERRQRVARLGRRSKADTACPRIEAQPLSRDDPRHAGTTEGSAIQNRGRWRRESRQPACCCPECHVSRWRNHQGLVRQRKRPTAQGGRKGAALRRCSHESRRDTGDDLQQLQGLWRHKDGRAD